MSSCKLGLQAHLAQLLRRIRSSCRNLFRRRPHESALPSDALMVLTMSTPEKASQLVDEGDPPETTVDPGDNDEPPSQSSSRPDSLNLDGWCVVSETALTKEMLQHLSKPEEIANLAASYLTRKLYSILDGSLDPVLMDQIFKAVQEVSENDEEILRSFIAELNEEQDREEHHHQSGRESDNKEEAAEEGRRCPRAVVKVLLELLRFSPVPVEHNILWVRLLSLLSQPPGALPTFIDLKVAATVLGTMTVHLSSAEIQQYGCRVLEPLAKFKPTPSQKAPVRESGIQVLLRTFEAHIDSPSIVLAICVVLANLTSTMSQFISWAVQQGYSDDEAERLVMMSMSVTDYVKENGLTLLDRAATMYLEHAEIQGEIYRIMACFGYHSSVLSSEEASPSSEQRKHSILKSPDSPRASCPQRRVTFSYDLDTRVEYQCSDSESDFDEPKRHTVCGGETVAGDDAGGDPRNRACKGRLHSREDKKLSFPNFKMEDDYLQMWQHILGEGLFSSICCDLAKLERDFDEMGSGSLSSSSNETVDLLDYGGPIDASRLQSAAKQSVLGPCQSLPPRCEMRSDRGMTRSRFATVPAYRYDFYQPNWQVQDTDAAIRNRLSAENGLSPRKTKIRPMSEPPPQTHFKYQEPPKEDSADSGDDELETSDDRNFTEYSEIDIVEALVRSGSMNSGNRLPNEDTLSYDEDQAELENKGNEEKENNRECLASERTVPEVSTQATTMENAKHCSDPNSSDTQTDPFSPDVDLLPIDKYLESKSLADDILSSFGIYENLTTFNNPLEPALGTPYGMFAIPGVTDECSETDDIFFDGQTRVDDGDSSCKSTSFVGEEQPAKSDRLDLEYDGNVCHARQATQQAFAKAFETLRDTPDIFHSSLTSSPTSSISSASLSLAEWSDLEALYEEAESVASMDTVTTQDTPPNSEAEMTTNYYHTVPKQRKINLMHRFSERKPKGHPPPKPRRTWYYRSSADVRKSLMGPFPVEVDGILGADSHSATVGRSQSRDSKRGLSLLTFGKASTNMSFDSGVVTGDDDESPTGTSSDSFPVEHEYEEVYMSKAELKPTLYERISRKGHYADVKKASKVQVQDDSSSEATYAVCTLWVNKHCVEALVTFDHLTKQLVSPYSILPAVRQLEGTRKSELGTSLKEMENDYPAWTSILNVLATEESKWTLSLAAQVLPIIDRLFYTKDEAIMDASVGLVQLLIRKFGHEIEKHHSGGLFRTRFRDDCRTCFLWLNKLYSRVSDLLKRDSRREDDLDSLLHVSLLNSLRESLKPFNGRISRGLAL